MIGDAGEDIGKPGLRIDVVELGGPDERVHQRRPFGAALRAGEQPGFPPERNRPIILPTSGRKLRSIIAGIRCLALTDYRDHNFDGHFPRVILKPHSCPHGQRNTSQGSPG
jgi:hypothetical protein